MLVLEAMKMQNSLTAGKMGKVWYRFTGAMRYCLLQSDYHPLSPHLYCKVNCKKVDNKTYFL